MKRSREPEEAIESGSDAEVSLRPAVKYTELDSTVESGDEDDHNSVAMRCSLPPHAEPLKFTTYGDYETHYSKFHTNRCLECRRNFPSQHLLGLHIEEFHDPLVVIKRDNGEHTYSCFVEGCERKCMTHQKRRMHMIDKHMYPKNFFFAITKDGIDGRRSLLTENGHRRRRSSTATTQSKEPRRRDSLKGQVDAQTDKTPKESPAETKGVKPAAPEKGDKEMTDLTDAMSSLQFVPPSIRFGRGRAGFSKT
ncbi:unnamed protein product [Clonostachys rosea]|uniref:C2H2-type domain-containing protein n=1 Tax=Bionectria ochroleuca TaxID=29856 RepID=A0ABY6UAY6_BIOOC|nr:unnamed protein product [Clonostachys rosea]